MFDAKYITERIRPIPDYPKKGILFRDITPLLKDPKGFGMCIDELAARLEGKRVDYVVGIEARGFIIAPLLAYKMGKGFVPIRKKGKLPGATISKEYEKEYGRDAMEMHRDALERGSSVVIIDDLLATGDTARAAAELVSELGAKVSAIAFIIELSELRGRERLKGYDVISLVKY
ncbi:MAG: adenine phosphoribosyltransferase [Candidatus Micrarchaeaceae archaeon]|jgi:adenine phosphoribosyltransferase|nr:adenine phosphoribosyltransferase [Candidatus Micrarchaeota archaeon]HII09905.1 adenine phosphoribosyltransferase [Candidatus Micrarchaeota archaeon]